MSLRRNGVSFTFGSGWWINVITRIPKINFLNVLKILNVRLKQKLNKTIETRNLTQYDVFLLYILNMDKNCITPTKILCT